MPDAPDAADEREVRNNSPRPIEAEFGARVARPAALVTLPGIDAVAGERIAAGDTHVRESVRNGIHDDHIAHTVRESADASPARRGETVCGIIRAARDRIYGS